MWTPLHLFNILSPLPTLGVTLEYGVTWSNCLHRMIMRKLVKTNQQCLLVLSSHQVSCQFGMHVWVVKTVQHAPGLCLHYIKHNRLTLAGPISVPHLLELVQQGPAPSLCSHHVGEQGRTIPLHYNRDRADLMERTLKPCRIQSLTWWILEERDDEENECWREGGGIEGHGVRSSAYMTIQSKWWYLIALEQTVIQPL